MAMKHIEWKTDEAIESNLIKTNLLFGKLPDKKATRDASFQKELLTRILQGILLVKMIHFVILSVQDLICL